MNELRWILIGFGIALLAFIYLWGRRTSDTDTHEGEGESRPLKPEPSLHDFEETAVRSGSFARFPDDDPDAAQLIYSEDAYSRAAAVASPLQAQRPVEEQDDSAVRDHVDANESRRSRVEPTFNDVTAELPVESETQSTANQAPTLSSGESPSPRRIERRKILALRLAAAPQKIEGARLLEALAAESLQHGKYDVFHRLHEDETSIFSVASMVEPGTFDREKMPQTQYPGITLFAQLPGPVAGMHALNELVACARRLQQTLGGTLQDDRGVPLTVHRIERMRQEVREFERPTTSGASARGASPPYAHH
jgi:cell division protein ZipA